MEFLPDSGHAVPSEFRRHNDQPTAPATTRRPSRRRWHLLAIKGDRTLAQLAEQFDVHPNQITSWKAQLEGIGPRSAIGPPKSWSTLHLRRCGARGGFGPRRFSCSLAGAAAGRVHPW